MAAMVVTVILSRLDVQRVPMGLAGAISPAQITRAGYRIAPVRDCWRRLARASSYSQSR